MLISRRDAALGLLSGAAAGLPLAPAWAQPAEAPPHELPETEEAPTKLAADRDQFSHLTAPVSINGQGPFNFILDTGANVSCISHALAERLQLAPAGAAPVHTMVGVRSRPRVMIDNLQVGGRDRRSVRAPAMTLFNAQVDGVLGVDWLKGQRLVLDFRRKSIEFTRSRSESSSPNRVVVPARRRLGQLTIIDADLSGHRISAMIDSGSQATLCNTPLYDLVNRMEAHSPVKRVHEKVQMETIAGEAFSGELFYLPFLRLGGLQLGNVPVVYADAHVFDLWDLKQTPAIVLGMDLLTQFESVALDFGRSQVRFDVAETPRVAQAVPGPSS
jgi:predicted aspartyl protease